MRRAIRIRELSTRTSTPAMRPSRQVPPNTPRASHLAPGPQTRPVRRRRATPARTPPGPAGPGRHDRRPCARPPRQPAARRDLERLEVGEGIVQGGVHLVGSAGQHGEHLVPVLGGRFLDVALGLSGETLADASGEPEQERAGTP